MTRINCIDPALLNNKHLLAEYRELPRVFGLVKKAIKNGYSPKNFEQFNSYKIGTGHVKFFYTRLAWLEERFSSLVNELKKRGYHIKYEALNTDGITLEWFGSWTPDIIAKEINNQRIELNLKKMNA